MTGNFTASGKRLPSSPYANPVAPAALHRRRHEHDLMEIWNVGQRTRIRIALKPNVGVDVAGKALDDRRASLNEKLVGRCRPFEGCASRSMAAVIVKTASVPAIDLPGRAATRDWPPGGIDNGWRLI